MGRRLTLLTLVVTACSQPYQTIPPHTHEECSALSQTEEQAMASKNPPSGWEVTQGTWGTDVDRDETTTLSVGASLKFPSTGGAATILSPWIPSSGVTTPGNVYAGYINHSFYARWRSSSTTAGHTFSVSVNLYDKDRTLMTNSVIQNGVAAWLNTWYGYGTIIPSTSYRWARFSITKSNQPFDLYVDSVIARKITAAASISGWQATPAAIPATTWTTVPIEAVYTGGGNVLYQGEVGIGNNADANTFEPGLYMVTGLVTYTDLQDGESAALRISWTDYAGNAFTSAPFWNQAAKDNGNLSVAVAFPVVIDVTNAYVSIETYHDGGGDRNLGEEGYFSITRIGT